MLLEGSKARTLSVPVVGREGECDAEEFCAELNDGVEAPVFYYDGVSVRYPV
jgi:hypothetical protein